VNGTAISRTRMISRSGNLPRVSSSLDRLARLRDLYTARILEIECENERFAFLAPPPHREIRGLSTTFARRPRVREKPQQCDIWAILDTEFTVQKKRETEKQNRSRRFPMT